MRFSIKDIAGKSKYLLKHLENKEIFTVLTIILIAFASFGLGRLSKIEERASPVRVENTAKVLGAVEELSETKAVPKQASAKEGAYVASKTGEKYHLPWCSGAQRIKEENKIWFDSKEAAEQAGYTPAANCKGL
ncbi:MAG: hypothetical protein NUV42_03050 [Candidatus Yonathbacteria bacterium]|nr:hypothetical protein [Candidatus Yonathbacteria bacterium]